MNDREYLQQMVSLTEVLNRTASAEPFDEKEWKCAVDEFHRVNQVWYHSRRKFSCLTRLLIFVLILLLAWIVYSILF